MNKIKAHQFGQLPFADKLRIAKSSPNEQAMRGWLAQLMPHSRLSDLSDEQLVELAECSYTNPGDYLVDTADISNTSTDVVKARVSVSAQAAFACIETAGTTLNVLLTAATPPKESLRNSAQEMRDKAAKLCRRADLLEAAAEVI